LIWLNDTVFRLIDMTVGATCPDLTGTTTVRLG
jgi:hypothetical protein